MNITQEQIEAAEKAMKPVLTEALAELQAILPDQTWIGVRFELFRTGLTGGDEFRWSAYTGSEFVEAPTLTKTLESVPDPKQKARKRVEALRADIASAEAELAKLEGGK